MEVVLVEGRHGAYRIYMELVLYFSLRNERNALRHGSTRDKT